MGINLDSCNKKRKNVVLISSLYFSCQNIYNFIIQITNISYLGFAEMDSAEPEPRYCKEPPAAPRGMGTLLYPWITEPLDGPLSPEVQMTLASLARHQHEKDILLTNKVSNHEEIMDRQKHVRKKKPYCSICSEALSTIFPQQRYAYHSHFSSIAQRTSSPLDHFAQHLCTTCSTVMHPVKMGHRIPVVITSSVLANWQGRNRGSPGAYEGDPVHLDYITIPGATIEQLQHSFEVQYRGINQPLDVILIAGYNNILRYESLETILNRYSVFKKHVINMSCAGGRMNSFAIATLPYPPRLTRLRDDPYFPDYQPYYDETTQLLDELTPRIINMNKEEIDMRTRLAPTFHTWCLSKGNSNNQGFSVGSLSRHRPAQWREDHFLDQLHPSDPVRLRMGTAVGRYFRCLYGIELMEYNSKQEWHEAKKARLGKAASTKISVTDEVPSGSNSVTTGSNSVPTGSNSLPSGSNSLPSGSKSVEVNCQDSDDDYTALILSDVYIAAALDVSDVDDIEEQGKRN